MLGKLPVPTRPTNLNKVGQGRTALAKGARGFFGHYLLSFLSF